MTSYAKYAKNTTVPAGRSKAEIERTLDRYGVDAFYYGKSAAGAAIGFTYKGRAIKLNVPVPDRNEFRANKTGDASWEKECRRVWRVLLLWIKANLEVIEAGLVTFEDVFLAQTCLPDGRTVGQEIQEKINAMVTDGQMPKLLT